MKISFFNWVHLLAPFIFALIAIKLGWDKTYTEALFGSFLITFFLALAPLASREEATGRSFRSKGGASFKEYREVESNFSPEMNYIYIVAIHLLSAIVTYKLFL
jgi:hypothetical protein